MTHLMAENMPTEQKATNPTRTTWVIGALSFGEPCHFANKLTSYIADAES
jgi:hypothetical protein